MNNKIITATLPSGTAVGPTLHHNLHQSQQQHMPHFSGNSLVELLPVQLNSPATPTGINIVGSGAVGSTTLSTTSIPVITSSVNSRVALLPPMSIIGATPLTTSDGDLSAVSPITSCTTPAITVINSTNNSCSQHNNCNANFVLTSCGQTNSSVSGNTAAMPINVILTGATGAKATVSNTDIATGEALGSVGGTVFQQQINSVIPASILIRNQPQYQSHGSLTAAIDIPQHSGVCSQATSLLPVLNQEIVKQIIVGNASKNNVITSTIAAGVNTTVNSSQTLLKAPSAMANNAAVKQQSASTASSYLPPKEMETSMHIESACINSTKHQLKKQSNTIPPMSIVLPAQSKPKISLAEAAKAVAVASASSSSVATLSGIRSESIAGAFSIPAKVEVPKQCRQSIPVNTTNSSMDAPLHTNMPVIKTAPISNASSITNAIIEPDNTKNINTKIIAARAIALNTNFSSGNCSSHTVELDRIKLTSVPEVLPLKTTKIIEKQESLLKVRPVPRNIENSVSPRSKRSKSLSSTFKEERQTLTPAIVTSKQMAIITPQHFTERRHSTASEVEAVMQKASPPRRKQTLPSKNNIDLKEYDIISLIDCNEEESQPLNIEVEGMKMEEKEILFHLVPNAKELNKIGKNTKFKEEINTVPRNTATQDVDVVILENVSKNAKNINPIALNKFVTQEKSRSTINELNEKENKVEIIMDIDQIDAKQQLAPTIEHEDILLQDIKAEDTQAQDLLEKSLYCDEKISISSTSSASTSSSRHSLQDDVVLLSSPVATSKIIPPNSTQSSTSTTASIAVATPTITNTSTSTEDSLSCALKMLSNFNMLTWNQRVGSARGTNMRFHLNEFNLIEINERCSPRTRFHTAYEKPIYERESVPNLGEKQDGLLYLCRRCNCHGPALDFLAPEFCSWECLKRDTRKRRCEDLSAVAPKRKTQSAIATSVSQTVTAPAERTYKKSFRWSTYLPEKYNAIAAPVNLFLNRFPTGPNRFKIGMKLEAIDPENCSLFCVCTVVDIQGYRLKLTFDGYEYMYDFWVNADSMDIFPPGWCAKTKRVLQPPKGRSAEEFCWSAYLAECKAVPAQRHLFPHLNASLATHNPFKIGMHLEAEDLNDTGKLCVASVADVLDDRIRVHFDGWDDCYDYWVDISSPYIHPCGWHVGRQQLIVPPEFENATFTWSDYIKCHGSGMAATDEMFSTRDPIDFKPNMKLEVVDPRNQSLIRPATVVGRKGHRIKLHLDCWATDYCFWLEDDSADLHPIGWCEATGHELEPPPGYKMRTAKLICTTIGCRGIGNAKRLYLNTHATRYCCPYAPENWRQKGEKPPRLEDEEIVRPTAAAKRALQQQQHQQQQHQQQQHQQHQYHQQQINHQQQQQELNEAQILQHIQLLDNIKTRHVIQQEKHQQQQQQQQQRVHRNGIAYTTSEHQHQPQSLKKSEIFEGSAPETLIDCQPSDNANDDESTSLLLPQLKIAKEFLYDYGPRLKQNYNIWQRNVAFDMQRIKRNPLLWCTKDTCNFVECVLQSAAATAAFAREDIDGSALLLLQQSDLTEMLDLKLGPAVKLYSCILQLRTLAVLKFDVKLGNTPCNN